MITSERKKQVIAEHATGNKRFRSPEVRSRSCSERISNLTEHSRPMSRTTIRVAA